MNEYDYAYDYILSVAHDVQLPTQNESNIGRSHTHIIRNAFVMRCILTPHTLPYF